MWLVRSVVAVVSSALISVTVATSAIAQEEEGQDPEDRSDRYTSIRGSIYKKRLARDSEDGYGATFKLQLSTSIYTYKSFDEFFDEETIHFNSLGLRPTLQYNFPTSWEHVRFIPSAEVQLTRRFDLDRTLLSGSVSGQLRYEHQQHEGYLIAYGSLKYGTRYDDDGLNLEDYFRLKFKATLNRSLNWSIGEHAQSIVPFVAATYYFSDLRIGESEDVFTDIETEYEIGMKFASEPRMKLWGVRVPEIQISFVFGDEVKGLKIRF